MGLFNFFTQEIAMDLGTANTLIIHNDEVVVNEPSIIALNRNNMKEVLAVGKKGIDDARKDPRKYPYGPSIERRCNCRL
jgi:actin-like ATPase involved in cell morphogenesis